MRAYIGIFEIQLCKIDKKIAILLSAFLKYENQVDKQCEISYYVTDNFVSLCSRGWCVHLDISEYTDEALIRLTAQKNNEAFMELASRYLWLIRAKARQCEVPAFDLDDLSQEGLLGLYDAALSYDFNGPASFKTYAGICISNRITSALRKQTGLKNKPLNDFVSIFDEDNAAHLQTGDMESTILFREMVTGVLSQVKHLLAEQEQKVLGMYLGGYNRKEIAQALSVSLKSVDNALRRIRSKFKRHHVDV